MRTSRSRLGRGARTALVTALLLPYLFLQSIAVGVMPVVNDNGLTFVICTGGETVDGVFGPATGLATDTADDEPRHAAGAECPWAIAHVATIFTAPSDSAVPVRPVRDLDMQIVAAALVSSSATSTPPARGPPPRT